MSEKIKILFFNFKKNDGVSYYRTTTPALKLQELYPDEFHVEIADEFNFLDLEAVKKYNIIHAHGTMTDFDMMELLVGKMRELDIKVVIDIDDYWEVPKTHPVYQHIKATNYVQGLVRNLKIADYVTCTTSYLADKITPFNKNVLVLENGVDLKSKNFKNEKTESNFVRIGYLAGSTHIFDINQMKGFVNALSSDNQVSKKFQMSLNGFDTRGNVDYFKISDALIEDLKADKRYNKDVINELNRNIHSLRNVNPKKIPLHYLEKYNYDVVEVYRRPADPKTGAWFHYEKILTDNHRLIKDPKYKEFLYKFVDEEYPIKDEQYVRKWTQRVSTYATMYNDIDISIAPLENIEFNRCKSELKLIEAFSRKIAVVASDVQCYNQYGVNEKNCLLVPDEGRDKKWVKALKRLLKEPNLRQDLGEQLYEDMSKVFNIDVVTKKRRDFYKKLCEK